MTIRFHSLLEFLSYPDCNCDYAQANQSGFIKQIEFSCMVNTILKGSELLFVTYSQHYTKQLNC